MERISTGRMGWVMRMFFNRSRPSGPFSEMSTMRTSGRDDAKTSIAPVASSASPHTTRSASRFTMSASPWRIIGWSSTTRILFLTPRFCDLRVALMFHDSFLRVRINGEQTSDHCSASYDALYFEQATDHPGSIVHRVKAYALIGGSNVANSAAIVVDGQRS